MARKGEKAKVYTGEFRLACVKRLVDGERVMKVAQDTGVTRATLTQWHRLYKADMLGTRADSTSEAIAKKDVTVPWAEYKESLAVRYQGILPDLFREGQGVIAEGTLESSSVFKADSVLAKHDEKYMPKEVADALKKQGHWKDEAGAKK